MADEGNYSEEFLFLISSVINKLGLTLRKENVSNIIQWMFKHEKNLNCSSKTVQLILVHFHFVPVFHLGFLQLFSSIVWEVEYIMNQYLLVFQRIVRNTYFVSIL